jgi:hypothetical protein
MYRWHRLGLLLLVAVLGLSGCQSAIRMDDLPGGSKIPLREIGGREDDKGSDFQIQSPGPWAVWQELVLQQPSNIDSIDIVEWSFRTDIYPASGHTWNTIYAPESGHAAGPWHMQNSWISLYEPGGSATVHIEFGFMLRRGDLASGHWAWYQVLGGPFYMDDGQPPINLWFRNCRTSSVQTVRGWLNRLWKNADGTWKWMIFLACNNGASAVRFNTRASTAWAYTSGLRRPAIWAEWEANRCPTNPPDPTTNPYAWKSDRFSNDTIVYFRSVFYAYVPKGTEGTRTTVKLNANNFDTRGDAGSNTNCISTTPSKRQLPDGRIAIDW